MLLTLDFVRELLSSRRELHLDDDDNDDDDFTFVIVCYFNLALFIDADK